MPTAPRATRSARLPVGADEAWSRLVATVPAVGGTARRRGRYLGRDAVEHVEVAERTPPGPGSPGRLVLHVTGTGVVRREATVTPDGDLACVVRLAAVLRPVPRLVAVTAGRLVVAAVGRDLDRELADLAPRTT